MFNMFNPAPDRIHYGVVWPYQEQSTNTVVDRHYCILAPTACPSGKHTFLGNPDSLSHDCPAHRKEEVTAHVYTS